MAAMTGQAYVSSVEFFRVGQQNIVARYPFHWHVAGNVNRQYITTCSIRKSFNRCVTIHGSHNALVSGNICYDAFGHGFFLEVKLLNLIGKFRSLLKDGVETGNKFNQNLAIRMRRPRQALIESDLMWGFASKGPASFWISNGNNTYTNNVAVSSEGTGFWYDTDEAPTGMSAGQPVNPRQSKFGTFSDNRVHNCVMAFSS